MEIGLLDISIFISGLSQQANFGKTKIYEVF